MALTRRLLGEPSAANAAVYRKLSPAVPQTRGGRQLPTLIIVGSRDPFVTEDTAYARRVGGLATLVIIGGAGHGIDMGSSLATQQL